MNILFLTDFSEASTNALNYAYWFAQETESRLTLLHAFQHDVALPDMVKAATGKKRAELMDEAKEKLHLCQQVVMEQERENGGSMICDYEILEGALPEVVTGYCKREKTDLIIMGTTGGRDAGDVEALIGSNAVDLFENANVPVLAIPAEYDDLMLKRIMFATDFQDQDDQILKEIIKICSPFASQIHLVHVCKINSDAERKKLVEFAQPIALASDYDKLHFSNITNDDPEAGVLSFAKETNMDMIVLAGKEHGFFKKMFYQSLTELIAYHTTVPLLVLPTGWKKKQAASTEASHAKK